MLTIHFLFPELIKGLECDTKIGVYSFWNAVSSEIQLATHAEPAHLNAPRILCNPLARTHAQFLHA